MFNNESEHGQQAGRVLAYLENTGGISIHRANNDLPPSYRHDETD